MRTAMAVGFSCLFLGMTLVDISVMSFVLQNEKIDGARMLLVRLKIESADGDSSNHVAEAPARANGRRACRRGSTPTSSHPSP